MLTNGQIVEMAKQAGFYAPDAYHKEMLIAFARLIEAAQREEDAQLCESAHDWTQIERLNVMKDCAAAIRKGGVA